MEYFEKLEQNPYRDLEWNIPERKQGIVNVIGGNAQNFRAEIKIAEFLEAKYPIDTINTVLPETLRTKLPPLPNLVFLPATETGTFSSMEKILETINHADFNLLSGDLSKNTITGKVVASACSSSEKPLLITRDSVDLMTENQPEKLLANQNLIWLASLAQLQKLFRAVYYPRVLLMSQSLIQVVEALHKFTLSYPAKIVTLHNGQILVAENGLVKAISLGDSDYSPVMVWSGELAARITAFNLYNPNNFLKATCCAIYG